MSRLSSGIAARLTSAPKTTAMPAYATRSRARAKLTGRASQAVPSRAIPTRWAQATSAERGRTISACACEASPRAALSATWRASSTYLSCIVGQPQVQPDGGEQERHAQHVDDQVGASANADGLSDLGDEVGKHDRDRPQREREQCDAAADQEAERGAPARA